MGYLDGKDKLFAKLSSLEAKQGLLEGLTKAAMRVEADAKLECPVEDGLLRASITHDIDAGAMQATIGTVLEYAPYVEFGTGLYAVHNDGRKTPWSYQDSEGNWHTTAGQHSQPFLTKALEMNKKLIKQIILGAIRKRLKR